MTMESDSSSNSDGAGLEVGVKHWNLTKMDKDGNVFEVLEGGDGIPTVCLERTPGMAEEKSYAPGIPMKEGI